MRQTRYKVDLRRFMAECEVNYRRLAKLFPNMAMTDERRVGLDSGTNREMVFEVLERSPHTTLLGIRQQELDASRWLRTPVLVVRVYHDARLAEVIVCEGQSNLWPRQKYPNRSMLHPDEKAQWNRFLGEWLGLCLARGFIAADICPVS